MKQRIEPLTKENAEAAIEGALFGYNGLVKLDGMQETIGYDAGLFKGTTKATINTAGKLGELVNNLIGINLTTSYGGKTSISSTVLTPATAIKDAEELLSAYNEQMNITETDVKAYFAQEKNDKEARINKFKEAMTELNASYKTGNVQEVADAVEKITNFATWSTIVPVGQIYKSMETMKDMAGDIVNFKIAQNDALAVVYELNNKIYQTKKDAFNTLLGFTVSTSKVAPELHETYNRSVDSEKIALDLIRHN